MRAWRAFKWWILARHDGYPDFGAYRTLLRQEAMSPSELAALRRRKTRLLVEQCLANVPYYQELMRARGITPESIKGPEDLETLPLLTKRTVQAEKSRMLNRSVAADSYRPHSTSGSSGTPLSFFRGWDYDRLANAAANMRAWRRMGWRPGDWMARIWLSDEKLPPPVGTIAATRRRIREWLRPGDIILRARETSPDVMAGWYEKLREVRPRFLYGYGSLLTLFANHLCHNALTIPGVRGIASTAEALLPGARSLLRKAFPDAIIIDIYGSREVLGIASECAHGSMHVNTDLVHVEYLADSCEPERHRLIVTALDNIVFPFIRYDIGDEGSPGSEACACGLPFPTMRWGFGRVVDSFITPDDRLIAPVFFDNLMYGMRGVHQYQFRQTTKREIILSVVPREGFDEATRAKLAKLQEEIHRGFSPLTQLEVRIVDEISKPGSGKHRYLVSEVRNPVLQTGTGDDQDS